LFVRSITIIIIEVSSAQQSYCPAAAIINDGDIVAERRARGSTGDDLCGEINNIPKFRSGVQDKGIQRLMIAVPLAVARSTTSGSVPVPTQIQTPC